VYLFNELNWTQSTLPSNFSGIPPVKISIAVDVPIVLWVPGVQFLGATYAAGIVQPFDYVSTYGPGRPPTRNANLGTRGGTYATVLIPGQLSWSLSRDLFVKTGFDLFLPDGDYEKPNQIAFPNSIGFWTLEPTLGITYVPSAWNFSTNLYYDYNFQNPTSHYTSGTMIGADYTAMRAFGKWGVGLGAYSQTQLDYDVQNHVRIPNSKASNYGLGPVVTYQLGIATLQATYNYRLANPHIVGTNEFWTDLTIPF